MLLLFGTTRATGPVGTGSVIVSFSPNVILCVVADAVKTAVSFSIPSLTNAVASISFIRLPPFPFNCNFLVLESYAIDNVADKPLVSCESTLSPLFIFNLTVLLLLVSALDTVTAFSPTY